MSEIQEEQVEWAVIHRMAEMLKEPPHKEFNVTQSYTLCLSILAWVLQRIRTREDKDKSPKGKAAINLKKGLEKCPFDKSPWGASDHLSKREQLARQKAFSNKNVFQFFKWMRDSTCHGDARNVTPCNQDHELIGFYFKHEKSKSLLLFKEEELRQIGVSLADQYCEALQKASRLSLESFVDGAGKISEGVNSQ